MATTIRRATVVRPFAEIVAELPFTPTTEQGKGFLAPLLRTSGHLLYLAAQMGEEENRRPTAAQKKEEIEAALAHWAGVEINDSFSKGAKEYMEKISSALRATQTEHPNWTAEASVENFKLLANRIAQLFSTLDREVLGIRESDAGFSL